MFSMNSTILPITNEDGASSPRKKKRTIHSFLVSLSTHLTEKKGAYDLQRLIHSIKIGVALVLVSLLYLLDPLYKHFGDNAMWAIMTVVVIFEFYAGATLSKGLNRGIGTILGGGLGCLAAVVARDVAGMGNTVAVGTSVFMFGAAASYFRLVPSIKRRYEYGILIFILTFNLVVVYGFREEKVLEIARSRLSTIGMGFAICVFTSLVIFPVWASDELHCSIASNFDSLACSIEGCLKEYFKTTDEKDKQAKTNLNGYRSVLNSKSKEELLANFARWEPWHGRFGIYYPWDKYLQIGELHRELAASIFSLKGCLQSPRQLASVPLRQSVKQPSEAVASLLSSTLRELGKSIRDMRRCPQVGLAVAKMRPMILEVSEVMCTSKSGIQGKSEGLAAVASIVFLLMEMLDKLEVLAKEVEELGDLAGFNPK